ncbi:MAG TPA: M15 family metallopeptidase, partial [Gemmatimonadaceae bacterium]
MSAGNSSLVVVQALDRLAPKFQAAVEQAIAEGQKRGLKPKVYETYRSPELQAAYYARGRTVTPPNQTVTNAQSNLFSWHGFGL